MQHSTINNGSLFSAGKSNILPNPLNDDCANATVLATDTPGSLNNQSFDYALIDATNCSGLGDKPAVWYTVNTDGNGGDLIITVTPSAGQDVAVSVLDGCSGSFINCVDNAGAGGVETVTIVDPVNANGGSGSNSRQADLDYEILVSDLSIFSSPGTFDIEASGSALPVVFGAITAQEVNGNVIIKWSTLSEINNDLFIIEHSQDGEFFRPIGKVSGAGQSDETIYYDFMHTSVKTFNNHYRIRQIDYDGRFDYSQVVYVKVSQDKVQLLSNIVTDRLVLSSELPLHFTILNRNGQVVKKGISSGTIDVTELSSGLFIILFDNLLSHRFIKE